MAKAAASLRQLRIAASRAQRQNHAVVDWGAGTYEKTAAELEPVALAVVTQARISPAEVVVDVACGTGNAALLAAARGAQVVGVDGATRLLEVVRARAQATDLAIDFRHGDLHALPIDDDAVDVVLSIFGVIFAKEPLQALREVARVLHPGGRALGFRMGSGRPDRRHADRDERDHRSSHAPTRAEPLPMG